jgi:iron complex outermembrane receptor protein
MIQAGLGTLDTSVDSLRQIAGTGIGVSVGNALPFSPELQANVGISYSGILSNGAAITPRADLVYQDRTFFDANNTVEIAQLESVSVVNLSLGYEPAEAEWQLTLGINNATDELYPTGGNSSLTTGSGYAEIAYARPREYFVSFKNSF